MKKILRELGNLKVSKKIEAKLLTRSILQSSSCEYKSMLKINNEKSSRSNSNLANQSLYSYIEQSQSCPQNFEIQNLSQVSLYKQSISKGQTKESQDINSNSSNNKIAKTCLNIIKITSESVKEGCIADCQKIIDLIHKIMSDYGFKQNNYLWKLVKIKALLLRLQLFYAKIDQIKAGPQIEKKNFPKKAQLEFIHRIPLFCELLKKDQETYETLRKDYYSYIELLLFYSIKTFFHPKKFSSFLKNPVAVALSRIQANYAKIKSLIAECLLSISFQLEQLQMLLISIRDKKIFLILRNKCEMLVRLYGLQLSVTCLEKGSFFSEQYGQSHREERNIQAESISDSENIKDWFYSIRRATWRKYEQILKKMPIQIDGSKIQSQILVILLQAKVRVDEEQWDSTSERDDVPQAQMIPSLAHQLSQALQTEVKDVDKNKGFKQIQRKRKSFIVRREIQPIVQRSCQEEAVSLNSYSTLNRNTNTKTYITENESHEKLSTAKQLYLNKLFAHFKNMRHQNSQKRSQQSERQTFDRQEYNLNVNEIGVPSTRNRSLSIQINRIYTQSDQDPQSKGKVSQSQLSDTERINNLKVKPSILIKKTNPYMDSVKADTAQIEIVEILKEYSSSSTQMLEKKVKQKEKKKVTIMCSSGTLNRQQNAEQECQNTKKVKRKFVSIRLPSSESYSKTIQDNNEKKQHIRKLEKKPSLKGASKNSRGSSKSLQIFKIAKSRNKSDTNGQDKQTKFKGYNSLIRIRSKTISGYNQSNQKWKDTKDKLDENLLKPEKQSMRTESVILPFLITKNKAMQKQKLLII